jgi:hypothetical protein
LFRAKKSRIALVELPSYQKPETDVVCEATSRKNPGGRPLPRSTRVKTAVIDLEKEPGGLKDVRYH